MRWFTQTLIVSLHMCIPFHKYPAVFHLQYLCLKSHLQRCWAFPVIAEVYLSYLLSSIFFFLSLELCSFLISEVCETMVRFSQNSLSDAVQFSPFGYWLFAQHDLSICTQRWKFICFLWPSDSCWLSTLNFGIVLFGILFSLLVFFVSHIFSLDSIFTRGWTLQLLV